MEKTLTPYYETVQANLDSNGEHGYNRHDMNHIKKTADRTVQLLLQSGYTDEAIMRRAMIAAYGHDLGNLVDRKNHATRSPWVLASIFPSLLDDASQWTSIVDTIILHDEDAASSKIKELNGIGENDELYHQKGIETMEKDFAPETLALIVADKTHVGRDRISHKANSVNAVNDDNHVEINLLVKDTFLEIEGNALVWSINFKPVIEDDEPDNPHLLSLLRKSRSFKRFPVSEQTRNAHKWYHIPWRSIWDGLFWYKSFKRNLFAIKAAFALNKSLEFVQVGFYDSYVNSVSDTSGAKSISKTFIDHALKFMVQEYHIDKE